MKKGDCSELNDINAILVERAQENLSVACFVHADALDLDALEAPDTAREPSQMGGRDLVQQITRARRCLHPAVERLHRRRRVADEHRTIERVHRPCEGL